MTMSEYTVTMAFSPARSRILVTAGADELLRAVLPPPHQVRNDRAALTLLEALALWLDRCPRVVVSAAEADATYSFGLADEIGNPQRSVYYTVEVVERPIRRRARRIAGVGDFRDLRQLSLIRGGQR
jgi:hypothetical protein